MPLSPFSHCLSSSLIKDKQLRPKYGKLMEHPFYARYNLVDSASIEKARAKMGAYVSDVLDDCNNAGASA